MACLEHVARTLVVVSLAVVPATVAAQSDWTVPRTSNGHPDLQGVWLSNIATPVERPPDLADRPVLTDEEVVTLRERAERIFRDGRSAFATPEGAFAAARRDDETYEAQSTSSSIGMVDLEFWNRTSLVIDPPNGRIPSVTPAGLERQRSVDVGWEQKTGPEDLNGFHRCVTTGVPRLGGNFGAGPYTFYQIVQTADFVVIVMEAFHDARIIPLDGRPHVSDRIRQWNGDSRGRWEGDTLVVETTNFSEDSYYRGSAAGLHLVERFTRTEADTLTYTLTFADASTWNAPWTAELPLTRREQPIYEFACHEGNRSMAGMLRTARLQDAAGETP